MKSTPLLKINSKYLLDPVSNSFSAIYDTTHGHNLNRNCPILINFLDFSPCSMDSQVNFGFMRLSQWGACQRNYAIVAHCRVVPHGVTKAMYLEDCGAVWIIVKDEKTTPSD